MKFYKFKKAFRFMPIFGISAVLLAVFFLFAVQTSSSKASYNSNKPDTIHINNEHKVMFKSFTKTFSETISPSAKPSVKISEATPVPDLKNPEVTPVPMAKPHKENVQPTGMPSPKPVFKTACLTFDDGPSEEITPEILDILDTYKIKATFFVIGANALKYSDILKRTYASGHTIGNHTYSHDIDYFTIRPSNMADDFFKGEAAIKSVLPGYNSKLARIPGGSLRWNPSYRDAVKAAGFHAVDWNCLTRDAEGANVPSKTLFDNVKISAVKHNNLIVLMHDSPGKATTVESLPEIIEYLKAQNFNFKLLK